MRKSTAHLKDASRYLSTTVNNGKSSVISTTCKRTQFPLIRQSTTTHYLFNFIPHRFLRNMSTSTLDNCHFNQRLKGSLKMFNLIDRVTINDLDLAIQSRNADKAWSLFVTLASQKDHFIPLSLCCSLYSLLKFAKQNNHAINKISKQRQRQLDHLLDYVQLQSSLDLFLSSVTDIPLSNHKHLLKAIRADHPGDAWVTFYKFHKDNPTAKLSRNTCLKLMLLILKDKQLNRNQAKSRLQLIALHGAGVSEYDSRYVSAADLGRLAHIYHGYQNNKTKAYELIDEFVLGIPKKKKSFRADALDELVWRILLHNDLPKALQVLQTAQSHHIHINELVFINLMNAFRRHKNYHEALKLFEQLLETGNQPSINAFNAVLQIFAAQGAAERASYIFDSMIQLNIQPDVATFTEMIRAHASQPKSCLFYYNKMLSSHIQPNVYTFSALIEASSRKNDIKSIFRWFQTMLSQGIQPNQVVISCILKSLAKQTQYPTISEIILQIAHQASLSGIKTDTALYTILLKMQAEFDGIEGALKIQRDMLENLVEPNTYTYTMLVDVCGKNQMPETAEKIFDLMKKSKKYKPNTVTYSVILDAWSKAERRDKVESIILEFLKECKSDKTGRFWLDSKIRNRIKSRCCFN